MSRTRKSPDRAAADAAIAAHEAKAPELSRNLPLPPEIANALAIIAKRNGKTLRTALADLAGALDLRSALETLRATYRAEADAEMSSLFKPPPEPGE